MKTSDKLAKLMGIKEGCIFKFMVSSPVDSGVFICKENYSSLEEVKRVAQKAAGTFSPVYFIHVFDVCSREMKVSYIGSQETSEPNEVYTQH